LSTTFLFLLYHQSTLLKSRLHEHQMMACCKYWLLVSTYFDRIVTESFCMCYSTNDVQDHVNSDADVKLPFAIQFDRELKDNNL
jgi:hypothetical protein